MAPGKFCSIVAEKEVNAESVLKAKPVKGELPAAPDDPAWEKAESIDVLLSGQVVAKPRWENPSVDLVAVKALYNDKEIAPFLWSGAIGSKTLSINLIWNIKRRQLMTVM